MTIRLAAALLVATALPAFAAGGLDETPPTPTPTTTECPEGQVFDTDQNECVVIQDSQLDDDTLYRAARELAYADRLDDAVAVLALMSDQGDSRVLTYMGYTHRRMGRVQEGMDYYAAALTADPDNLLARAYLGMAHVLGDDPAAAWVQLAEIQTRGGRGTWPEQALQDALNGTIRDY